MPGKLVEGPDDHLNFDEVHDLDSTKDPLLGAVVDSQGQQAPAAQQQQQAAEDRVSTEDDVPEKYRGKTAAELLDIARNQDSVLGRQANELGELRSRTGTLEGLVDKALNLRDPTHGREEDPGTEEDLADSFQDDPVGTISRVTERAVERATAPLKEKIDQNDAKAEADAFTNRHPSAAEDVNNQDFIDYCSGSEYRKKLAMKAFGDAANGNYDFDAADELWAAWEEKQNTGKPAGDPSQEDADLENQTTQQPNQDAVPTQEPISLVPAGNGDAGGSGKPTYSQAALNDLQANNPDYYWRDDVQAKISEARREGRVT